MIVPRSCSMRVMFVVLQHLRYEGQMKQATVGFGMRHMHNVHL